MTDKNKKLLTVIIVIAAVFLGYAILTKPDNRTMGEKIGDAVDTLERGEGLDKAGRQLQDRTLGEKTGDAVKDLGDEIKDKTDGK